MRSFLPPRFRRLLSRLTQLFLAELLRPRGSALQAALAPKSYRRRVFRRPGLFLRRRADGLPRDGFQDRRCHLVRIERLRFWSGSFHACIMRQEG